METIYALKINDEVYGAQRLINASQWYYVYMYEHWGIELETSTCFIIYYREKKIVISEWLEIVAWYCDSDIERLLISE